MRKPPVPIVVIARLTFQEALRRKVLLAALVLGLAFLGIYGFGFAFIQRDLAQGSHSPIQLKEIRNFHLLAGLYVVNFLFVMMAVLSSVDTLAGEIHSGTIQALAAKPIRRREIVLGKWLGFAGMLTLYLILMAGGVMAIVYAFSGHLAPNALRGLGLLWLNGLMMLSVSLFGGAVLSTLANGALAFGLFGIAFVGGWIEHIGSFLDNETAIRVGIVSSLLLPSEALWQRASFEMQSAMVAAVGFSPFSGPSVPSPLMVLYAAAYAVLALLLAMRQFGRRDI